MFGVSRGGEPTCRVVKAGAEFIGKQGHLSAPGIAAQSVGAPGIPSRGA
jgi:uncharacterized RmlC-like cupin family protein